MAQTKKVKNIRAENQLKAIHAQAGFVRFVTGKVEKVGIEKVLTSFSTLHSVSEYMWLKKAYERVLDFAEQVQIKEIASKIVTEDEDGKNIPLVVYLPQVKSE